MPYSSNCHDDYTLEVLKRIQPSQVWDVGAGAGKYGRMIQNNISNVTTIAVEIDHDYIEEFNLEAIYSRVLQMPAEDLLSPDFYNHSFDTVIIGDCIEHLKKSQGLDLLNFLIYRSRWIIVLFPVKYIQNTIAGKHREAHISVWGDTDFCGFDISETRRAGDQVFVLIKGYL